MSPAQVAQMRELRERGLTYREIGERHGVSADMARFYLVPERREQMRRWHAENRERSREHSRAWKRRNREHTRAYDQRYFAEHKHPCPRCGHLLSYHRSGKQCPGCVARRREQVVEWWSEGLTLKEIAQRLDWTVTQLGVEMFQMRKRGYDLPYRRQPKAVA